MAAALPLQLRGPDAKEAWLAQEIAKLTPEERAQYDRDAFFRGIVHTTLEQEWQSPGPTALEQEAAEKYGGDMDRCIVENILGEVSADFAALRAERYGDDFQRELADLQRGVHPTQLGC